MDCPREGATLRSKVEEHEFGTFELHACPRCWGVFATGATVADLRRKAHLPHRGRVDVTSETPGKLACPECRSWLQLVLAEGIELDVCVECEGIWFDADELRKVPAAAHTRKKNEPGASKPPSAPSRVAQAAWEYVDAFLWIFLWW